MEQSLRMHILHLEHTIQSLRDRLTKHGLTREDSQGIELQISLAELALARYREAYSIEVNLPDPRPPHRPGPKPERNKEQTSNSAKKEKLAARKRWGRKKGRSAPTPRLRGAGTVAAVTARGRLAKTRSQSG